MHKPRLSSVFSRLAAIKAHNGVRYTETKYFISTSMAALLSKLNVVPAGRGQ
jgi:hypothetical protein